MAYATPSDLIQRYDVRSIGQLVSDDDTMQSGDELLTDPNVLAALDDASGRIDAACLIGQRYLPTDLANLTGNSAFYLARLACQLAFTYLRRRRSIDGEELPEYEEAKEDLERLRTGVLIFGDVQAVVDAGNPVVDPLNAVIQARQGLLSSIAGTRWFPSRPFPNA
jgi:phage gp36-like protein